MQINTKVRYGLRTMIQIALDNETGVFQREIAEKQELPIKYLDHIISALKAENLIIKARDERKGYVLSRPEDQITIFDIYSAFQPTLSVAPCGPKDQECERKNYCSAFDFWAGLNQIVDGYFKGTTLASLAGIQREILEKSVG